MRDNSLNRNIRITQILKKELNEITEEDLQELREYAKLPRKEYYIPLIKEVEEFLNFQKEYYQKEY
jgi:hypothetical protein